MAYQACASTHGKAHDEPVGCDPMPEAELDEAEVALATLLLPSCTGQHYKGVA